MVERVGFARETAWAAHDRYAPVIAVAIFTFAGHRFRVKPGIVSYVEIEMPVFVIVDESRAGAPAAVSKPRPVGDIGKGAVVVVSVKDVASEAQNINVGPAVVVIVADSAAHGPPVTLNARL